VGWMRGNGSGDNSLLLASFWGVEKGFEAGRVCSTRRTLLPLFLTGEKGLADVTGGSTLTACDFEISCFDCRLGGVDGCVLALFSFLYSLYFSAEGDGRGQRRPRHQLSSQDRTKIWSVLDVLDGGISPIVSLELSLPGLDFYAKSNEVHGRKGGGQRSPDCGRCRRAR
jgi:hypothetical protein